MALLVDGLQAEREQGITIDVAYRYFSTARRKFIISDTPGHEQYTRNMATGASTCDLAIILIDARKGVLDQTRRHSFIASLLGIKQFVVAVNMMDLVEFSQEVFERISADYREFAKKLSVDTIHIVPVSALDGDNVVNPSDKLAWYEGETLLALLGSAEVERELERHPVRLPVQYVNRPNLDFRGFAGTLASGILRVGDKLAVLPSGKESTVTRIVTFDGDLEYALPGQAITVTFADEIDISRGDLLVDAAKQPQVTQNVLAHIVWMGEESLQPGRVYDVKLATKKSRGQVEANPPPHRDQQARRAARQRAQAQRDRPVRAEPHRPGGVRPVSGDPRYRQLYPDRPADQRHRRRRHDSGRLGRESGKRALQRVRNRAQRPGTQALPALASPCHR